jgi:8-oxo-dGTP pyrophosphatase MutT (NUDIX family)
VDRAASLLAQLHGHTPADETEARHRDAVVALLDAGDAAFSRTHHDPGHITASAFIVDGEGRLLLHHHRRLDRWLQMGGHVEPGEDTFAAAMREGREESGLDDLAFVTGDILDVDVHPIAAGRGEPEHRHFDIRYLVRTAFPGSIRMDAAESRDLAWFTLERAVALMDAAESARVIRKIAMLMPGRSVA